MSDASRRISKLSAEQIRALAARIGSEARQNGPEELRHHDGVSQFPLSFFQERLWFLERLNPDGPAYNLGFSFKLNVPIDVSVAQRALNEIVARHDILRTRFAVINDEPVQLVEPDRKESLEVRDLSGLTKAERHAVVAQVSLDVSRERYDLEEGRLFRTLLLRLGTSEWVLVMNCHHIIADGWSLNILLKEMFAYFLSHTMGKESSLKPLPVQFGDFAVWERQRLQGARLEKLLTYWKDRLAGLSISELPTDRPRPKVFTFNGMTEAFSVGPNLAKRVRALNRELELTSFVTYLGVFAIFLSRSTGVKDVVLGVPIANRPRSDLEGVIGPFSNQLVVRLDTSGNPTVREFFKRVWSVTMEALEHQALPFELLVEELNPVRDVSRNPLFQVVFHFEDNPGLGVPAVAEAALENFGRPLEIPDTGAVVDMQWRLWEKNDGFLKYKAARNSGVAADGVHGNVVFNNELFDRSTVQSMIDRYLGLLDAATADPDRRLDSLGLLTPDERQCLTVDWARGKKVPRAPQQVYELFRRQAAAAPDAIAVVCGANHVTYGQLDRRVRRLSAYLRSRGVGTDVLVGSLIDKSVDAVIAAFAIWAAGGAYVPLDAKLPKARVSAVIADVDLRLLVTSEAMRGIVEADCEIVTVNARCDDDTEYKGPTPGEGVSYVIYTSGSTGTSKGAALTHAGLSNMAIWSAETLDLGPGHRILQCASLAFDLSVWDITVSLCSGATLVLPPPGAILMGPELVSTIADYEATHLLWTPSALASCKPGELPSLEAVMAGGEPLSPALVRKWTSDRCKFFNMYGPSETTVLTHMCECVAVESQPHIGKPMANVQAYVLDSELHPVAAGAQGELCIGGIGVGRGYINRPDLTAEKYVPDPYGESPGGRLYRTGDIARWLPDGNLECLGRMDHQVKVRGHRVELGEIDAVLEEHPHVDRSVTLLEGSGDSGRLVAYLVLLDADTPPVEDLRAFLADRLPAYMVPSIFQCLERMPLGPTGKIDRSRLAMCVAAPLRSGSTASVSPRSEAEASVFEIWRDVLGVATIGVHDNFFEIGGTSLLLVRVHDQLQEQFPDRISIMDLFRYPTIASTAVHLAGEAPTQLNRDDSRASRRKTAIKARRKKTHEARDHA